MRRIATTLVVVLTLLAASVAMATTVVKLNFDQLVEISDAIVVGEVTSVDAVLHKGRVFTHVDIKVRESLKGDETGKLEIVHIGGRTRELVTKVAGMPSFRKGELALLFLEKPAKVDHYVVTGLAQGKMELEKSTDGTLKLKRDLKGVRTVDMKLPTADVDASTSRDPTITPPRVDTLDAARARITDLLKPNTNKTEE